MKDVVDILEWMKCNPRFCFVFVFVILLFIEALGDALGH